MIKLLRSISCCFFLTSSHLIFPCLSILSTLFSESLEVKNKAQFVSSVNLLVLEVRKELSESIVDKRANDFKVKKAKKLFKKNKALFTEVENKFSVEKEILLALWGIETNFGKHVGKMDIISSLATLSYDKRRRDFFSLQLFTLLELIDRKLYVFCKNEKRK